MGGKARRQKVGFMKGKISIQHLLLLTHLVVFVLTALFVGFSTYSLANYFFAKSQISSQLSEKVSAEQTQEYLVYERREVLALRPNGHHKIRVTGFSRNLETNEDHIVYTFVDDPYQKKFQSTQPTATLLSNGNIFINGVSDFGFAVLDIAGNNLTSEYRSLLSKRDFLLSHVLLKDGELIYTSRDQPKIYWKKRDQSIHTIHSEKFPGARLAREFWLKPMGWSGSRLQEFYISREASFPASAQLFRVSLKDKKVQSLASVTGTMHADLRVCPEQDYAVFIAAPIDPTLGAHGNLAAPSRLMMSDLLEDRSVEIAKSEQLFTDLLVSCESKRILISDGNEWKLFSMNEEAFQKPSFKGHPLFLSRNGETIITNEMEKEIGYTVIGLTSQ